MTRRFPIPFGPVAVLCLALAAPLSAWAKDLGVRGQTWAVAEPDLLAHIEARLAAMERSGALARLESEARSRARTRMEAPERVAGMAPARERRTWLFDPAVTVERDIAAADGTVLVAAGTRIDPFAHSTLTGALLFIDGARAVEVSWALHHARRLEAGHGGGRQRPAKIILTGGRPLELARVHGRPFFFDQGGRLSARFGLRATPSLITREGNTLRITEIPLDEVDVIGGDVSDGSGDAELQKELPP